MKDQEFAVEKIRSQYAQPQHTDLDALKALDKKVKKPANVFGYVYGSIGAIVMGSGMSLVLTDIGTMLGMTETLIPGIAVGAFVDDGKSGRYLNAPHFTGMTLEEAVAKAEAEFDSPY